MENQNDEMEIQHRLYIQDEEINVSQLPNEIKQAMRSFNAKLKKYEESEDENEENQLFYELQQDDVAIADDILTWWEDENSEDDEEVDEEEEETVVKNQQPAQQKPNQQQQPAQQPAAQVNTQQTPPPESTPPPPPAPVDKVDATEQKVRDLIKNNIISVSDLTNAIGGEPEYPEHQVGKILLRKQYLKPFYEVQS